VRWVRMALAGSLALLLLFAALGLIRTRWGRRRPASPQAGGDRIGGTALPIGAR